ncbi:MAG TPA: MFS transporter [Stellaceae bacterium]|nr:MFS transporter [Stellaceae bacterium]
MSSAAAPLPPVTTQIPARLDRLPWSRFHLLVAVALGITWVLDGLEVTIVGAVSAVLEDKRTLGLSPEEIGAVASFYLAGAVLGALLFGWLTDRLGRKRMFYITLATYLAGVALSALAWDFWSFAVFRALTGAGIGGEYAAINSAIDELMPGRLRGRIDLIINGSYWLGAAAGAAATVLLLDPAVLAVDVGWRIAFAIGAALGLLIMALRRFVPESPRWLVTHGRPAEAEAAVAAIERRVAADAGPLAPAAGALRVHPRHSFGFVLVMSAMFGRYRARSLLALALMLAQAFLYNALFFTYGLVLTRFHGVAPEATGIYLLPLAAGNFLGPLLLGRFFDTIGRRVMIAATYTLSAALLVLTGWLFAVGALDAATQTLAWCAIFFFASAAASAAYLTASEIFPLEVRALAIACYYALGTAAGGIVAPWLFGRLIGVGSRWYIFAGYAAAAILMAAAALVEWLIGVDAERRPLEEIAAPLSAE